MVSVISTLILPLEQESSQRQYPKECAYSINTIYKHREDGWGFGPKAIGAEPTSSYYFKTRYVVCSP